MATFTVGRHPSRKFIQRVLKINACTKSLVERLCDLKIFAISVLSFFGSVCAPDKATLKAEVHAPQCTTVGPYHAIPSNLHGYRTAACSNTLNQGLEKIQAARAFDFAPILALCPSWERNFLLPLWLVAPRMRSILYVVWTAMASLMRSHRTRNRRLPLAYSVTNYTHSVLPGPISLRASKILGPICRHRVADILTHMKRASRASRLD